MHVMNANSTAFKEADVVRDSGTGRFAEKNQSAPELTLGSTEPQPVIINSPVGGDRRANLWIKIPEGQATKLNVFEAGIGRPEEDTWREDTITFRRTEDGIRAVYEVTDDDISTLYAEAFAELDEAEADAMKSALRNEVRVRSFGNSDVFFPDGYVEFRHTSDHPLDADDGFHTANVFSDLERDPSYVMTRDGVLFTSAYSVLSEYGFED